MKESAENDRIQISLDAEQYRELLSVLDTGILIKGAVLESRGETLDALDELENVVLKAAIGTDAEDFVQKAQGRLLPSDDIMDETEDAIVEYNDDQFWLDLSDRLGQRDFCENADEHILDAIESNGGLLPDGVRAYYEKYDKEFDKHGLDRLRVDGK